VASGGFEVAFGELEGAAAAYKEYAGYINGALSAFNQVADLNRGDFGRVPEAAQMWKQYQEFLSQVEQDVKKLGNQLLEGGAKLLTASNSYQAAEQANTSRVSDV
jgi:uncharacterized protein YukE